MLKSRLFTCFAVFTLLLAVAVACSWSRSRSYSDYIRYSTPRLGEVVVATRSGRFWIWRGPRGHYFALPGPKHNQNWGLRRVPSREWKTVARDKDYKFTTSGRFLGFDVVYARPAGITVIEIPHWAVAFLAILPSVILVRSLLYQPLAKLKLASMSGSNQGRPSILFWFFFLLC